MRKLTATLCLTIAVLLGSAGVSRGDDALDAYRKGDYATALREFTLLAKQGNADAQNNLGGMYFTGRGVIHDIVYAHMWSNIAASTGDKEAVSNRDLATKRMTPSQLEKAQDLARECIRKKYKGC